MNKRNFLKSLPFLFFTSCVHWPGVDQHEHDKPWPIVPPKEKNAFKAGDRVLVVTPGKYSSFDFGVGIVESCNCGMGSIHPTGTYCVRFHEIKHKYGHYKPEELVKVSNYYHHFNMKVLSN